MRSNPPSEFDRNPLRETDSRVQQLYLEILRLPREGALSTSAGLHISVEVRDCARTTTVLANTKIESTSPVHDE
jgi:hypothetical protein